MRWQKIKTFAKLFELSSLNCFEHDFPRTCTHKIAIGASDHDMLECKVLGANRDECANGP
jgi:hypothetical protein